MIKSFEEYLNESESSNLSLGNFVLTAKYSATEHLDNIDEKEARESAIDGYAHIAAYLYKTQLLPEIPTMKLLEKVSFLGSVNTDDDCKELMDVAFPGLYDEDGYLQMSGKEIWEDKYWKNSPGANSIEALEYQGVRMCFWQEGDGPYIFIKSDDLLEIMKKTPESIAMFPDAFDVLSNAKVDVKDFLYQHRGRIGGKKFGL